MISITYSVGDNVYKSDVTFNHLIDEATFHDAVAGVVGVFNRARQGVNINTTEVVEAPAPKETEKVISLTSKKEKAINVE